MEVKDLSILIPARNEMFLSRTIEDILSNIEANTEVIVVLDGKWADPPIPQNERVNVIYLPKSIGQRAATNLACKLSKAKYVMKLDAHCAFDKGFDRKMIEAFKESGDNVTMVPIMRNLWAFDWKCYHCGWKKYQGPTPAKCEQCGKTDKIKRKMIWIGKHNPQSTSYCFDSTPHFQYFEDWKHRPQYDIDKKEKGLTETMSLQGSCWMITRDKYWELNICDENFGSWGSQGIEVAVKTWLSGGRVLVNHKTWYAHMFRTQGGDFSFPYPISSRDQEKAKKYARELFFDNNWDKQVKPLNWLVEKFWPVKGWTEEDLQKLKNNNFEFKSAEASLNNTETEPNPTTEQQELEPAGEQIEMSLEQEIPETVLMETIGTTISVTVPETGEVFMTDITAPVEKRGRPKKLYKNVTIIGDSFLGKSVQQLFPEAYVYDTEEEREKANKADIAFICLPTPTLAEGQLDISEIEKAVAWCECPLIVLRSTVNPGTCDYLSKKYNKRILVQPEYMGEGSESSQLEEKSIPFMIIGGKQQDRRILINLYSMIFNTNVKLRQVSALEAEVIKLTENRAILFKVAQCQELYEVCEKAGIDYYTIRDAVYGDDPRFNLWWTFVSPDKKDLGLDSNVKDVLAWCAWAESVGLDPEMTRNTLKVNRE